MSGLIGIPGRLQWAWSIKQVGDRVPRDKSILCATWFGNCVVLLLLSIVLIILITNEIHNKRMPTPTPNGAIFTRWGRSVCPEDATLLYEGVMASGYREGTGGPTDYFCLPKSPQYANTTTNLRSTNVYLVKYGRTANDVCSKENAPGISDLTYHFAVCAVCRSSRVGQLMIPGQITCLQNWRTEYFGYLMSSHSIQAAQRSTVCVDHAPDGDKGRAKTGFIYLDTLQRKCVSGIPCHNYIQEAELTCVLCTQ